MRGALLTVAVVTAALASAAWLVGCKSCRNERPYVPYAIDEDGGDTSKGAGDAAPESGEAREAGVGAVPVSPGATSLSVAGLELSAPRDRVFLAALTHDVDGDGADDVLAIVGAAPPKGDAEIVLYRSRAPADPAVLVTRPAGELARGCSLTHALSRVGRATAHAEIGVRCATSRADREVWALRLDRAGRVVFHATLLDPPRAAAFDLSLEARDVDGDGSDDLTVTASLAEPPAPLETGPKLSARYVFLDRPAGLSREASEPLASLSALEKGASARRAAEVPAAIAAGRQARALVRAVCGEPATRRLKLLVPADVRCDASKVLEALAVAEVRARALSGDALRAFGAEVRARTHGELSAEALSTLGAALDRVAPPRAAESVRALGTAVEARPPTHPRWAPIAFEPSGALLVSGEEGVVRYSAGVPTPATDVTPWPREVLSEDGRRRLLEGYDACDGGGLHATLAASADGDIADVLLPVAGRRTRCTSRGEPVPVVPLAWDASGLSALFEGEPVRIAPDGQARTLPGVSGAASPKGSPRSPDGQSIALATPRGVLVGPDKPFVVTSPLLAPYDRLGACTVASSRAALACVQGTRVLWVSLAP